MVFPRLFQGTRPRNRRPRGRGRQPLGRRRAVLRPVSIWAVYIRLRGFKYRSVAPREKNSPAGVPTEPIGGDTYWFGSLEYSVPIFEKEGGVGLRFALFYDIGAVDASAYSLLRQLMTTTGAWACG